MNFFSRKTSERLLKLGCKSESGFQYSITSFGPDGLSFMHGSSIIEDGDFPAFHESDFTGTSAQAKDNAIIVANIGFPIKAVEYRNNMNEEDKRSNQKSHDLYMDGKAHRFRHAIIDSDDAEAYILETMKGKE